MSGGAAGSPSGGRGKKLKPYIRILCPGGYEFYLERRCAMVSTTIRDMLTGGFREADGEIAISEVRPEIMERVIQYFHHKVKHSTAKTPPPDFAVDPETALDLLMAASFFQYVTILS